MAEANNGGGNLKYAVAGVLLLGGTAAMWFAFRTEPPPPPPPAPAPEVERVNPLAKQELILEEPEVLDAGKPAPEPEEPKKKRKRFAKRDTWECAGDIDRAGLMSIISENRSQVRTCYERRLKVNNVLQGNLKLKIKVGADGKVAASQVGGTLRDNEIFGCVRRLAQSWRFPSPKGGNCAVVQVPFNFTPKGN